MSNKINFINDIWQHSKYLWNIWFLLEKYYEDEEWFSLLPLLFLSIEKSIKISVSNNRDDMQIFEKSFSFVIKKAFEDNLININEKDFLNNIRSIRNMLFHDMEESNWYIKDWKIYMYSENETFLLIYKEVSEESFKLILKLLKL